MIKFSKLFGSVFLFFIITACSTTNNSVSGTSNYRIQQVIDDNSLPNEVGKLIGVVKDAHSGDRLNSGTIFFYTINQRFPLNEDGSFSHEIPAGKYAISFESEGYDVLTTSTILVRTKTSTFLNVQLQSSNSRVGPSRTN